MVIIGQVVIVLWNMTGEASWNAFALDWTRVRLRCCCGLCVCYEVDCGLKRPSCTAAAVGRYLKGACGLPSLSRVLWGHHQFDQTSFLVSCLLHGVCFPVWHACVCVCEKQNEVCRPVCVSNLSAVVGDCRESFHQPNQKNHKAAIPQVAAMLQALCCPLNQSKQVLIFILYLHLFFPPCAQPH